MSTAVARTCSTFGSRKPLSSKVIHERRKRGAGALAARVRRVVDQALPLSGDQFDTVGSVLRAAAHAEVVSA